MAITRNSSARTASPTPLEDSEMYWDNSDDHRLSLSPAPSQTADANGWDSDSTPGPMDSLNSTPTLQPAHISSPASVVEITCDDYPPLLAPTPATATKAHATKATKAGKGKAKAKATNVATTHNSDRDDPFLATDIARATTKSLGLTYAPIDPPNGASSSHRPNTGGESPTKCLRANSAGDAAPPTTVTAIPSVASTLAGTLTVMQATAPSTTVGTAAPTVAPTPAPRATSTALPAFVLVPVLVPVPPFVPVVIPTLTPAATPIAAPMPAPFTAPAATLTIAAPTAAPAFAVPAATPIAAPAAVPHTAPAAAPLAAVAAPATGAPALPPIWLTADGLPHRGSYAPTPAGGFPTIAYSPEQLLHGVPTDLLRMYKDVAHPKFFLVVSGGNGAVMKTHGLIREAISDFINIAPTDLTLGTPPTANGTSPALWFATGIPDHLAQAIINEHILSLANITLFSLPYDLPIIGFMGIFAGFTLPNSTVGTDLARDLLHTAIKGNKEISQFVQTHRDTYGPLVSAEQAWEIFLALVLMKR